MRIKQFVEGREYATSSICDHNCIYRFKVTRRTAKSVWITGSQVSGPTRRTIHVSDDSEFIFPHGRYSMAPVLRANRDAL